MARNRFATFDTAHSGGPDPAGALRRNPDAPAGQSHLCLGCRDRGEFANSVNPVSADVDRLAGRIYSFHEAD